MSKNLLARIIVAAIFIPFILWISYQGGWWLYGLVMFLAMMAMSEFLIAEGYKLTKPAFWLALVATLIFAGTTVGGYPDSLGFGLLLPTELYQIAYQTKFILLVLLFLSSGMVISLGKESPGVLFARHSRLMWGVLYIGFLYPYVYSLDPLDTYYARGASGGDALLFLFALLWIGDTAAMFVGKTWGKHQLAPAVSPNKTVEGFIGGLLAAIIVGIIMAYWKFTEFPLYHILIVAVLCSLFGQLGDLVESMWKRSLGIKDSSAIIPGHGGFLDRFDSLLFAAPVMYYYFYVILR